MIKLSMFVVLILFISAVSYAQTPLFDAVRFGVKANVETEIAAGANVNARDDKGRTPIFALGMIIRGNHPMPKLIDPKGIAELLISKGADINAKDNDGDTPLHYIDDDLVDFFISKGAKVDAKNNKGETPLHATCSESKAKWLLAKKADINARDNDGRTPLFNAVSCALLNYSRGGSNLVALYLDNGADPTVVDKSGKTPSDTTAAFQYDIRTLLAARAKAQKPNPLDMFTKAVGQLKTNPKDDAVRQQVISLALTLNPAPALSEDAEKFEGRAQYAFKNAKSDEDMIDAAREYLKAVEAAPWVSGYYFDICTILEKANRPVEAMRACKLYLNAAPNANDAGEVRKKIAGLEYAVEKEKAKTSKRSDCSNFSDLYEGGAKVANIAGAKVSIKLINPIYSGVPKTQIIIADITAGSSPKSQRKFLDPIDIIIRIDDNTPGTPSYHLTIGSDGRITFGSYGNSQPEIMTSVSELTQLRNDQLKGCQIAVMDGKYYVELGQGGTPASRVDGANVAATLYFASDCSGNLTGDKPGTMPAKFVLYGNSIDAAGFTWAGDSPCKSSQTPLGWLSP